MKYDFSFIKQFLPTGKTTQQDNHLLDRELSLLMFNRRVLAQAEDADIPLLERLKYLAIVSNNLDEFFEVRIASLKSHLHSPRRRTNKAKQALTQATLKTLAQKTHALVKQQYQVLNDHVLPALAAQGIVFLRRPHWSNVQRNWIGDYFDQALAPLLTPIAIDPAHPFPRVQNKSLHFVVMLKGQDSLGRTATMAIVPALRSLPRFVLLPGAVSGIAHGFVLLSSILHDNMHKLFPGLTVQGCHQFRVTRDSELTVDEDDAKDLRTALQGELKHRQYGEAVRLEVDDTCPQSIVDKLLQHFQLAPDDLYRVQGPVNLARFMLVPDQVNRDDLKFPRLVPNEPALLSEQADFFAVILQQDILLHHPYQSFTPVIRWLQQAARDPQVVVIKMTVYRTSADSALMEALIAAAQAGKEVTVVVELMARFDEEANINWADKLERAGVHVVYGIHGHKTHAKMLLIVRRETPPNQADKTSFTRYVHLGTGNYHPHTALLYTDFSLFTADAAKCADVNDLFNQLTGISQSSSPRQLWFAPFTLHRQLIAAIKREADHARTGQRAVIIAKMNALIEPGIIQALYAASQAGVIIRLIVRGICTLQPGVKGLSEHIQVQSIVGRFLEHSRIYYFHNAGKRDVYLASADWMGRNFFHRIEIAFPIQDAMCKRRIIREGLYRYLSDTTQSWIRRADGSYQRIKPRKKHRLRCAQKSLLAQFNF